MKFGKFIVNEAVGMLDVKTTNLDALSDQKVEELFDNRLEISEKFDGTKLTLIRTHEKYEEDDDPLDYWIVSFKNILLTPEEFKAIKRDEAREQSYSNAQYAFVFDMLKRTDPSKFKANREYFVEFLMRKSTLVVKYSQFHNMILIGYGDDANPKIEGGKVYTYTKEMKQDGLRAEAEKFGILTPHTIFKGSLKNFIKGVVDADEPLKEKKQKQVEELIANYHKYKSLLESSIIKNRKEALKKIFLNTTSIFSEKRNEPESAEQPTLEGFVIQYDNKFIKIQDPKVADKSFREKIKSNNTMDKATEDEYFKLLNKKAHSILNAKKMSIKEYTNYVYNDPTKDIEKFYGELSKIFGEQFKAKKTPFHMKDQLMIELKTILSSSLSKSTHNEFVLIPGRFNPATNAHIQKMIVENALERFPDMGVIIQLVVGSKTKKNVVKNPFDIEFQKDWILTAIEPKLRNRILFLVAEDAAIGRLLASIEKSGKTVKVIVAGDDRADEYKAQLDDIDKGDIEVIKLSRKDNVSSSALKAALLNDDENLFKKVAHPNHFNRFSEVKDKYQQLLKANNITPEEAERELEK